MSLEQQHLVKSHNSIDALLGKLCLTLVLLMLFGLQIQMIIPFILQQSTTPFSIAFRGLCLFISIIIIGLAFLKGGHLKISFTVYFFLCFYLIYFIRFLYDIGIRHINLESGFPNNSAFFFYSTFIGTVLIPTIAILLSASYVNIEGAVKYFLAFSFLQVLFITIDSYLLLKGNFNIGLLVGDRYVSQVLLSQGTDSSLNPLNAITLSKSGVICCTTILYKVFFHPPKRKILILYVLFFFLGIGQILLGASRSPVLAIIIIFLLYFVVYFRKAALAQKVISLSVFVAILTMLSVYIVKNSNEIALFQRMSTFIEARESGDKEVRDYQWQSAWNQFLSSPLYGDKIIENERGMYSHNEFLDVVMATGVLGAIFYGLYFLLFMRRILAFLFFGEYFYLFYIGLFVVYMFGKLTSGSLFSDNEGICYFAFLTTCRFQVRSKF